MRRSVRKRRGAGGERSSRRAARAFERRPELDEIERLHNMRVSTRRLRAAMEVFEPCFPRERFRATLKEVKAIADALGERRDRDVSIDALTGFADALGEDDRLGVELMIEGLRGEQRLENERLVQFVDRRRLADLRELIRELTAAADLKAT